MGSVMWLTEIANDESFGGIGSPFAIDDIIVWLDLKTVFFVALRQSVYMGNTRQITNSTELVESTFGFIQGLDPFLGGRKATLQWVFEGTQPWVEFDDS